MKTIEINLNDTVCGTRTAAEDWTLVLNGIVWECMYNAGFSTGYRNEVAVTMTVAAYLLGLEPIEVLDTLIREGVIDPDDDDENTWDRVYKVLAYTHSFSWDWALNTDLYRDRAIDHADEKVPVKFRVI